MDEYVSVVDFVDAIDRGEVTMNDTAIVAGRFMMWLCDNEDGEHVIMNV